MNSQKQTEVVIIGAGVAGLTAALSLREKSIPFVVLEARYRVGEESTAGQKTEWLLTTVDNGSRLNSKEFSK